MKVRASNCHELTEKAIDSVNEAIAIAKEKGFTTEQVNALNTGNIVQLLGAIAHSLSVIADIMKEEKQNDPRRI